MKLRVATSADIQSLLQLQQQCHIDNLSSEEAQDGFLNTVLNAEQLAAAIAEQGVILAERDQQVIAMAVCGSWDYWQFSATLMAVAEQLDGLELAIDRNNSIYWGPVAVSKASRGSGVFTELVDFAVDHLKGRYRYIYSYVHHLNHRSLAAHINKAQFELHRDLDLGGQIFREMILPL